MSADSEKPNITGGIWMKYCTVAKNMGRDRPISVEVNGCARVACALRPSQSISFHFIADILRGLQKSNIHTCQSCSPARVLVPGKWKRR